MNPLNNFLRYAYSENFPRKGCPFSLNFTHLLNGTEVRKSHGNSVLFQCAPPLNTYDIRKKKLKFIALLYPLELDIVELVKAQLEGKEVINEAINPHNFDYIHNGQFICEKSLSLILVVKSGVNNFSNRQVIRETWGNVSYYQAVKIVFLLGYKKDMQGQVDTEALEYGDVVQEDFVDSYSNNTLKTIMGLNWVSQYCSRAKLSFYVDDDVFIIVNNLQKIGKFANPQSDMLFGKALSTSVPYRDNTSKWFVSWEDYPFDSYPRYLAGFAYIMSADVVKKFVLAIPYIKPIQIDDTYLGIIAEKLKITPKNQVGFYTRSPGPVTTAAARMNFLRTVAFHRISCPDSMMQTWKEYCKQSESFCTPEQT